MNRHSAHLAVFKKNNVLLVKRKDVPVWVIPGGFGEEGETPLKTALREFEEETGAKISSEKIRLVARYYPNKPSGRHKFLFSTTGVSLKHLKTTDETTDYDFFDVRNLPDVTSLYEKRKILEAFLSSTNAVLIRKDSIHYLSEVFALIKSPVQLIHLLYLYSMAKSKRT